jgi:hypothetical protein
MIYGKLNIVGSMLDLKQIFIKKKQKRRYSQRKKEK